MVLVDKLLEVLRLFFKDTREIEKDVDYMLSLTNDWIRKAIYEGTVGDIANLRLLAKVKKLRLNIETLYNEYIPPFTVNTAEMSPDYVEMMLRKLPNYRYRLPLDGKYYSTDKETFKKIVEWDWSDTRRYVEDRFDCDKFAMYFKSRVSIDFGVNTVGVIFDYDSGHAYNVVILTDVNEPLLFEPQNDLLFKVSERNTNIYALAGNYIVIL